MAKNLLCIALRAFIRNQTAALGKMDFVQLVWIREQFLCFSIAKTERFSLEFYSHLANVAINRVFPEFPTRLHSFEKSSAGPNT